MECDLVIKGKIKSITTDNGMEFAAHEIISKSMGGTSVFC